MDKENSTVEKQPLAQSHNNFTCQTPKGHSKLGKQETLLHAV